MLYKVLTSNHYLLEGANMISIPDLKLGFRDAENYQRRENKQLFNTIFIKNRFLDELLSPNSFFLLGEKGTGKTAFAVYLVNNHFRENISLLKYIRETDYQKFVTLKKQKHLQLSEYTNIWKVILLLLLADSVKSRVSKNRVLRGIILLKKWTYLLEKFIR